MNSSNHTSPDALDNEEAKGDKAISQLILNRNKIKVIPVVKLKVASLPISISSSDDEHSNDLACAPLRPMSGAKILHLFGEASDSEMRFRNLKKKTTSATDPPAITAPSVN